MKNIIVFCLAMITSFQIMAQQHRISGTIVDSQDGKVMIGVNIIEKGTSNGTVTDFDGKFTLNVNSGSSILIITSIGYESLEVNVSNRSIINLEMKEDTELLDEVVVIAYGS